MRLSFYFCLITLGSSPQSMLSFMISSQKRLTAQRLQDMSEQQTTLFASMSPSHSHLKCSPIIDPCPSHKVLRAPSKKFHVYCVGIHVANRYLGVARLFQSKGVSSHVNAGHVMPCQLTILAYDHAWVILFSRTCIVQVSDSRL